MNQTDIFGLLTSVKNILDVELPSYIQEVENTNPSVDLTAIGLKLDECISLLDNLSNSSFTLPELPAYSLNEQLTENRWIDGKPLYRKTISFGVLPNSTSKSVAHGIVDAGIVYIDMQNSFVIIGSNRYPLVYSLNGGLSAWANLNSVSTQTSANLSSYSAYISLFYTKVGDTVESPVYQRVIE